MTIRMPYLLCVSFGNGMMGDRKATSKLVMASTDEMLLVVSQPDLIGTASLSSFTVRLAD